MQKLVAALAAFHADVGKIVKGSKAQYGLYADLATVLSTVTPALAAQGLVVTQTFQPWDGGYTILRTTLAHSSGETIISEVLMPREDNARNPLHSFGAACTYLRRYALLAILNLAAEDDDGESFGSGYKPASRSASPSKAPAKSSSAVAPPAPTPAATSSTELSRDERSELLSIVTSLNEQQRNDLVAAFRSQFKLPADVKVSDYIRDTTHAEFIRTRLNGTLATAAA
ncbi:MAG: ERF family protein [Cyanobacteriota bacterium]|nr:ERF family protein [Cyanobacteriota bacterium]